MNYRNYFATGMQVSEVGLGTWQLGGTEWGDVTDSVALSILDAATESGVNFIDTADIYGAGRSEKLIGQFLKNQSNRDRMFIATKFGRGADPGWPENFTKDAVVQHTENSLERLGVEAVDLTQTHCLPQEELNKGLVWETLRELKAVGKIRSFGASVESMDEARQCLQVEGLSSLQIIFNVFRQKPIEELFAEAKKNNVAIIVRLPLASGLLAGKINRETTFAENDHRHFNRDGQQFNVGETFAGLPLDKGIEIAGKLKSFVPAGQSMAQWAIQWCLSFPAVTTVIPGATKIQQAKDNAAASELPKIDKATLDSLETLYRDEIVQHIRGKY